MIGVGLYSVGFTSGFLVNSLFLQQLWHEPMRRTGQALLLSPLLSALSALLAGHLADRVGHRWLLVTGCLLRCFGYLLSVCLLGRESQLFDRFVPISGLIGLGSGIATWSAAGLSDVDSDHFATANAMMRTTQQILSAFGVSSVVTFSGDRWWRTSGIPLGLVVVGRQPRGRRLGRCRWIPGRLKLRPGAETQTTPRPSASREDRIEIPLELGGNPRRSAHRTRTR